MKLRIALVLGALTFAVDPGSVAYEKSANLNDFNEIEVRILEATDARDAGNPVFDEALAAEKWDALVYLGQIGGEACEKIKPYIMHASAAAQDAAALGAAACHDSSFDQLLVDAEAAGSSASRLIAMGFSGGAASKAYLTGLINSMRSDTGRSVRCRVMDPREVALFALMQSIVYDRLEASALPDLDIDHLLALTSDPCIGYKAAYLMGRLQKLNEELAFEDVVAAMQAAPTAETQRALVRVLRQYGNQAGETLISLAGGEERDVAMEAVRAMASLGDADTLSHLVGYAAGDDAFMRHLALEALARRDGMDTGITQLVLSSTNDPDPWVAVTALRSLSSRSPAEAQVVAAAWFGGDDYYKAFSAMGLLAQSDEGKAVLQAYADANPETIRGREAAIALDPSIEGAEKPRKTPSWGMVRSYQERELKLSTTRGSVCIKPSSLAPYAAANFMLLADVGKMDGMLWHRVIPNFVAQAGQSEDPELANWGTIREEWWGSLHVPGTVGVATAGRDTGSTQFFINTAYNMHLNGRYTVMGHVTKGLDAAMQLREGDVIEKAETVRGGTCN